jgi:hypothetical protein
MGQVLLEDDGAPSVTHALVEGDGHRALRVGVEPHNLGTSIARPGFGRTKERSAHSTSPNGPIHDQGIHDDPGPALLPDELRQSILMGPLKPGEEPANYPAIQLGDQLEASSPPLPIPFWNSSARPWLSGTWKCSGSRSA